MLLEAHLKLHLILFWLQLLLSALFRLLLSQLLQLLVWQLQLMPQLFATLRVVAPYCTEISLPFFASTSLL